MEGMAHRQICNSKKIRNAVMSCNFINYAEKKYIYNFCRKSNKV